MTEAAGLLDTNVVVACVIERHPDHAASVVLLEQLPAGTFGVAAHSHAEAFATMTRLGSAGPFRLPAVEAWALLEVVRARTELMGLSPAATLEGIRRYAASGGIGARLSDALIGEVALVHRIPAIITWNTRHMRTLFPRLAVKTPAAFLAAR